MAVPTGAYAVAYKLWLFDDTSENPVDIAIEPVFTFSPSLGSTVVDNEDAAAAASMEAWKATMETAYPGVTVHAAREYLIRSASDAWPWPS